MFDVIYNFGLIVLAVRCRKNSRVLIIDGVPRDVCEVFEVRVRKVMVVTRKYIVLGLLE